MRPAEAAGAQRYVAAHHVEGQAAMQIRASGSSGGTLHHNNPNGTCPYCDHMLPTLLPEGAVLTIVPPAGARAATPRWRDQPTTYVGTADDPVLES